jgi:hypothetical protein
MGCFPLSPVLVAAQDGVFHYCQIVLSPIWFFLFMKGIHLSLWGYECCYLGQMM